MKSATLSEIKSALGNLEHPELLALCLKLAKSKADTKLLLSYLLFDASDQQLFIDKVKEEILADIQLMNQSNAYYIKKSLRKVSRSLNKYIKFTDHPTTEIDLRLFFASELATFLGNASLAKFIEDAIAKHITQIEKRLVVLHEDIQYDYHAPVEALKNRLRQ